MNQTASRQITSYDVLKTLGVFLMITDHIGLYLYPDMEMLRVVGRLAAPIFLFLIGFARTREVPFSWVFWLALDLVVSMLCGIEPRPNILLTLMLVRLSLDYLEPLLYPRSRFTIAFAVFCFVMTPLTVPYMEYGTFAWMLAAVGLWARRDGAAGIAWMACVMFGYFTFEALQFGLSDAAMLVFAGGLICLMPLLACFNPDTKITMDTKVGAGLYRFFGRYTLVIYALHLIVLKIIWFLAR